MRQGVAIFAQRNLGQGPRGIIRDKHGVRTNGLERQGAQAHSELILPVAGGDNKRYSWHSVHHRLLIHQLIPIHLDHLDQILQGYL